MTAINGFTVKEFISNDAACDCDGTLTEKRTTR